eukprot:5639854-Alexandrium_andersonii.AAC.1
MAGALGVGLVPRPPVGPPPHLPNLARMRGGLLSRCCASHGAVAATWQMRRSASPWRRARLRAAVSAGHKRQADYIA